MAAEPMILTHVERCAFLGMQALSRELSARYQAELHQHAMRHYELLADIAAAHDLPIDAFITNQWGIDMATMQIVPVEGITPPENEP